MSFTVLIPDRITEHPAIEQEVFGPESKFILGKAHDAAEISDAIWSKCDAILGWHELKYTKEILSKLKKCKVIVRVGAGYDNVDLESAAELGIKVCNVPNYGTDDVADHTMALILGLCRGIINYNDAAKNGIWNWETGDNLRRIKGSTLGIIGLGRIGTAVALRAKSFGLAVRFYDPYKEYGYEKTLSVQRDETLFELAAQSDIISIHTPLTDETYKMIDHKFFNACRPNSIFINTARGLIVDMDALYAAMISDKILFAGLDVLQVEPADDTHPLIKEWKSNNGLLKNRIIITPHSAFYNRESYSEMRRKAADEALRILTGGNSKYQINSHKGT